MTLAEKLHAIQRLARKVPKNGVHEHGWGYMQVEDVVTIGTRFLRSYELILTPNLKSMTRTPNERGGSIVDVIIEWELRDTEDVIHFDVPGSGFDYESKGTAKALTDSRKSALILIFNLKGGDEPERAPVTKAAAKDRQQEIADNKLANAAAGKGIDADAPALYYQFYEESKTALITGDKELMKRNADLLKEFKLGAKVIVSEAQLDVLRMRLEERGLPFKKLQAT
jgi:ERF superfamily